MAVIGHRLIHKHVGSAGLPVARLLTVFAESIGSLSLHPASDAEPSDWG
jgi:hypothetical protein